MADMMDTSLETLFITTMCNFSTYILAGLYLSCGGCIFEWADVEWNAYVFGEREWI